MRPRAPVAQQATVSDLVASLFEAPVVCFEGDPAQVPAAPLAPEEAQAIARAIDKRRQEFATGRTLARRAMVALGADPAPIPMGEDRAPRWPAGVVGTITHTGGWCAAALARQGEVRALGADVEQDTPLEERLWDSIATADELERWRAMRPDDARRLGKLVFSAKECAYKAQYLLTQQFLGFGAMAIEVSATAAGTSGVWQATFQQDSGEVFRTGDTLEGRFVRQAGLVATAITLR